YLHADHLNTPRLATDANQRLLWSWNSDAFGVGPANPDVDGDGITTDIPLRFPGQLYDAHSALHYNYFRDYDPETGRYVESDPIGLRGGLNTYGYVYGNPLKHSDPKGLFAVLGYCFVPGVGWAACASAAEAAVSACAYVGTAAAGFLFGGYLANEASQDGDDTPPAKSPPRGRPWTGEPGSTTEPNAGGDSRRYGNDGYPEVDYDAPHPDEAYPGNVPHAHNWDRPKDGGPPTHKDRGHGSPYSPIP
ncbi:RHS repeat-associated core domain-containing protein, partial [Pseudomonas indica]|uniref:RHS repeat-associated core domain-containing protein n=1 Tax=Pseudomonas indica TaxID=137658 RepID=UPI0023F809CD